MKIILRRTQAGFHIYPSPNGTSTPSPPTRVEASLAYKIDTVF